jgi:hypothetical protein
MSIPSYFVNSENNGEYFSARSGLQSDYFYVSNTCDGENAKDSTGSRESSRNVSNDDNGGAHGISVSEDHGLVIPSNLLTTNPYNMLFSNNNLLWPTVQKIHIYAYSETAITSLNTMTAKFNEQVD